MAELMYGGAKLWSITQNITILSRVERLWDWLWQFDGGRGLLSESGILSTGESHPHIVPMRPGFGLELAGLGLASIASFSRKRSIHERDVGVVRQSKAPWV